MKTHAIVCLSAGQVELRELEVPQPDAGEVLIETLYTCISPGTELRVLSGGQAGSQFPLVPGYSLVGRVIASRAAKVAEGTLVFSGGSQRLAGYGRLWGGHIGHAIQHAEKVFPLAPGTDPIAATPHKLSAISLHGCRCAPPMPEDRVAVVGLGPIGQLAARHYAASGANVLAVDVVPWRVEMAQAAGVGGVVAGEDPAAAILQHWPDGADIIVDCTGAAAVLPKLVPAAREIPWDDVRELHRTCTYVIQGSYPGDISMNYLDGFMKELRLVLPRDNTPQDIRLSIERVAKGKLQMRDLVRSVCSPSDAASIYAQLKERGNRLMTVAFDWSCVR